MPYRSISSPSVPRRVARISIAALSVLGLCTAQRGLAAAPASTPSNVTEEVKETERRFAATMARRDLAGFADLLSDEAIFFSGRSVLRGKPAVVQAWTRFYEGPTPPFSWEPERVEVLDGGSLALSTGPVRDAAGQKLATFNSIWRREADGRWRIVFDKGEPVCAPMASAPTPPAGPPPELDSYASAALQSWRAPGLAIAVVRDGRVVLARGFGQRALGSAAPVDEHTRFAIASLTKMFTAAAAGQEVSAGRLTWDEPLAPRLPGFALRDARVTTELSLRDVLSHRSGIDEAAELLWLGTGYDQGEVLARLAAVPQAAPLRSTFTYSNVLYSAAGQLIARSAGASWQEVIRKRLLEPAGMSDSTPTLPQAAVGNVARPHAEHDGALRVIAARDVANIAPAAALHSSASDLARWLLLLLGRGELEGRRVLEAKTVDTLLTPQLLVGLAPWQKSLYPESHFLAHGLGFMLQDYRGRMVAWGTGGIDGYACSLALLPEERLGVVVLTNVPWTGLPEGMVYWLLDRYLGAPAKDWSAVRLALSLQSRARQAAARRDKEGVRENPSWPLPPARLVGSYRSELLGEATITAAPNGRAAAGATPATLQLRIAKSLHAVLEPWRADALRIRPVDPALDPELCTFTTDAAGAVQSVKLGDWGVFQRVGAK